MDDETLCNSAQPDELAVEPMAHECGFAQYPARSSVTLAGSDGCQPVGD
jgi:hypothetical protein